MKTNQKKENKMDYKLKLFNNRLIDSVWTIVARINEKDSTAQILEYSREIELGYKHEKYLEKALLSESKEGRIVEELHVLTDDKRDTDVYKTYRVINPKHIFEYSK